MPLTTNDSHSPGSPNPSEGADGNRKGSAAGVEVPVVVHASRYSASASSVGKSLPPVHEETRTVIVFDQGAVVRLSAAMIVGEVVVLTNKATGADVICKVANVKAQPGIQNYVSLEFTQRAPGFWGESTPSASAPPASVTPSVVAAPSLTPRAAKPAPLAESAPSALPSESVAAKPAATAPVSYSSEQVASVVAEPIASTAAAPTLATPASRAFDAGATLGLRQSSAAPSNLRAVEFSAPRRDGSEGIKNVSLIAVAAVVLLALVGIGGWLLLRPSQRSTQVAQAAHISETAPQAPVANLADPTAGPAAGPAAEPAAAPESVGSLEPSSNVENRPESPAIQPAAAKSASAPAAAAVSSPSPSSAPLAPAVAAAKSPAPVAATEAPRRPAIDVTKMRAPSVKAAAASTSSEAPPELLAQPSAIGSNSLNDNLLASSSRNLGPATPPALGSSKGGQLLPPKLISAPAAVYPAQARAERIQGDVSVDAFVDSTGKVAATKVIAGPPLLQQAAMSAVRAWTYKPARLDGQPISIHIRVDVSFHLQ